MNEAPPDRAGGGGARRRRRASPPSRLTADLAADLRAGDFAAAQARYGDAIRGVAADPRVRLPAVLDPDAPVLKAPVFVCGLHRSGTSLLVGRLVAAFEVSYLRHLRVPEDEGQFIQDVYPQERPAGGPGSFAFSPWMRLRPVINREKARRQAQRLSAAWGSQAHGSGPLLEKSPSNVVRIAYLRSLFPDARFIVWTRDPRAVSMATQKWRKRIDLRTLMMHWVCAHQAVLEDLGPDCVLASYEAFCDDPDHELSRIASFCGLSPRTSSLDVAARFETIRNSNEGYIAAFPPAEANLKGVRLWEAFGYEIEPGREDDDPGPDDG